MEEVSKQLHYIPSSSGICFSVKPLIKALLCSAGAFSSDEFSYLYELLKCNLMLMFL